MTKFSAKLFFPQEQKGGVDLRLRMFSIKPEAKAVLWKDTPPATMLSKVSGPNDPLLCYQLTADPPLVLELIRYIEGRLLKNRLETLCLNLHEDSIRFGLAISEANYEGDWREFVTPEGTFMKLEHLFVPRTMLLPHFPEFGIFVRSWNTWKADGRTPED